MQGLSKRLTLLSQYGDPLLDQLDIHKVVHHRLFRESCYNHQGNYVKVDTLPPFLMISCPDTDPLSGPRSSRPRPPRNHHHRQLPYLIHLPPPTRRPNQQLVLRRPRQRTPRPDPRPRRPRWIQRPRRQPRPRRRLMTTTTINLQDTPPPPTRTSPKNRDRASPWNDRPAQSL